MSVNQESTVLWSVARISNQPTLVTGVVLTGCSDDTPTTGFANQPTNITGATITGYSANTPRGITGTLTFTKVGNLLTWKAPGEATAGAAVCITAGGFVQLYSSGGSSITLLVVPLSLPAGNQSDTNISTALGTLAFATSGDTLTWTAQGDTAGSPVNVGAGGAFTLSSNNGTYITVTVTALALPVADETDYGIALVATDSATYTINGAGAAVATSKIFNMSAFFKKSFIVTTTGAVSWSGDTVITAKLCTLDGVRAETAASLDAVTAATSSAATTRSHGMFTQNMGGAVPVTIDLSEMPMTGIEFVATAGDATHNVTVGIKIVAEYVGA
jgi:hypothetical protein